MTGVNLHTTIEFIWVWLALANLGTFVLFGIDKRLATRGAQRRISERTLLLFCALGGAFGGLAGIILFRHKTAKLSFLLKYFGALVCSVVLAGAGLRGAGIF